jgi:hypothetical protein
LVKKKGNGMKRQIRKSVLETNSSSMHSLTIKNGKLEESHLYVSNYDNKVETGFGEYGWEIENYADQNNKLRYILTMCACTEGRDLVSPEEFYETEGFKSISQAVANYCNCDGIKIKANSMTTEHLDYCDKDYLNFDGYIDHQSCEDYESVADFLSQHGISSVEDFIFNNGIIVHTDNDNY